MKRMLDVLRAALFLSAIALLLVSMWTAMDIKRQADADAPKIAKALDSVASIEQSTHDLEQSTYATEGELANLADTMNGIASGLSEHEAAELKAAQDLSGKLNSLADDAHATIVLSQDAIRQLKTSLADTSDSFVAVSRGLDPALKNLAAAGASLADTAQTVGPQMIQTSAHFEAMTADGAQMTADGRQVADHYRQLVLKPVNKVKAAAEFAAKLLGDAAHAFF